MILMRVDTTKGSNSAFLSMALPNKPEHNVLLGEANSFAQEQTALPLGYANKKLSFVKREEKCGKDLFCCGHFREV